MFVVLNHKTLSIGKWNKEFHNAVVGINIEIEDWEKQQLGIFLILE